MLFQMVKQENAEDDTDAASQSTLGEGFVHCSTGTLNPQQLHGTDAVMIVFDKSSKDSFADATQVHDCMTAASK